MPIRSCILVPHLLIYSYYYSLFIIFLNIYLDNDESNKKHKCDNNTTLAISFWCSHYKLPNYIFCGFGPGKNDNFILVHNITFSSLMSYNTNVIWGRVVALEIEIALRDEMVRFIQQRIITNLEALQRFLGLNENRFDEICAGIYTYAVEEYGKIRFLRDLNPLSPPNNNKSQSSLYK